MSTVHATAVQFGSTGILLRGASGAGKSRLAHMLILRGALFGGKATLVADDRVVLESLKGRLMARPPDALAGLLEVRGLGIIGFPHLDEASIDIVLDLLPVEDVPRLPNLDQAQVTLCGVTLPRAYASSPESGLDILLTMVGHSGASIGRE